jgi:CRISPR-associated protein Csd1
VLHEVIRYAETEGLKSEPGFKHKWVRWLLVFNTSGDFLSLVDLKGDERNSKGRAFARAPELTFGELISNKLRHFLIDSIDKVALLTKDEWTAKDLSDHESFVSLLRSAATAIPSLGSIAETLDNSNALETIRSAMLEQKAKSTDAATLAIHEGNETRIFVNEDSWHSWWRDFRRSLAENKQGDTSTKTDSKLMRCFVSGALIEPTPTQNKISGLSDVGGLSTGDVISSFDKDAFQHYNFKQGENAAISEASVKAFTDSLNHLIQNRSHRICGTKIVYWYSQPVSSADDPMIDIFDGMLDDMTDVKTEGAVESDRVDVAVTEQERLRSVSTARALLDSFRSGQKQDLANCEFFALTLSGSSGRVVIRDWMQGRFSDLVENVNAWFSDLSIISRDGKSIISKHKFAGVLGALVRDLKDIPSPTVASLWRCALERHRPIPLSLMSQTLARVRIDVIQDQAARHARLGFLRAFCIRNLGVQDMTVDVDDSIDCPAYLCGRIMALLAMIQEEALGNVGAGVVQRYYAAASATPALVLGRLVRTAQVAHLTKKESKPRLKYFDSQMMELWSRMRQSPPTTLSLQEQTLFAMGFYQQQAARYQKKSASADVSESADAPTLE